MRRTKSLSSGHRRVFSADAAMAAVILLLGLVLAAAGGSVVQRWRSSPEGQPSLGFEDQLGVAANTAGLIVIVWWAMSFVIAFAAALLDRSGNVRAASAAGKFTPAFMRRLALAVVGLQLVTAQLATASSPPVLPGSPGAAPATSAAWTLAAVPSATGTSPTDVLAVPGPAPEPGAPAVAQPQWRPLSPAVDPGVLAGPRLRDPQTGGQTTEVTVRPGDSLWSLSSARLGPYASDVDVALDWPRIYQANRDIIGTNPNLLRPGQVLQLPPGD